MRFIWNTASIIVLICMMSLLLIMKLSYFEKYNNDKSLHAVIRILTWIPVFVVGIIVSSILMTVMNHGWTEGAFFGLLFLPAIPWVMQSAIRDFHTDIYSRAQYTYQREYVNVSNTTGIVYFAYYIVFVVLLLSWGISGILDKIINL